MKKFIFKIVSISVLLLIGFSPSAMAQGKEYKSPMSQYGGNYFIFGDNDDQVKFQISMKYNLLYPFNTGVYFGYTQLSYWRLYDKSSPFAETNYMPEIFYMFESGNNIFNNFVIPFVDHIKVSPFLHRSNGKDDEGNRSENKFYGEIQLSYGEVLNFGGRAKVFGYYNKAIENKDINKYHKYYEAELFFKLRSKNVTYLDKEEISVTWGGNPFGNGYFQAQLTFRILTSYIQPRVFVQYFRGYDEFMVNFDKKTDAIRAGLIF